MNKLLLPLITFFRDDNLKFRQCIVRSFLVTVTSALLLGAGDRAGCDSYCNQLGR